MDFLSAIFFIVAGVWLLAAIIYSLMVFYFLRLRSLNLLHTIHDEEFGRWYIFPKCVFWRSRNTQASDSNTATEQPQPPNDRYYISFGWMFRRYARHLNIDAGIDDRDSSPRYKRSERRKAVRVLLLQQQLQLQKKKQKNTKMSGQLESSSSVADAAGNLFQRLCTSKKSRKKEADIKFDVPSCSAAALQKQQNDTKPLEESDLSCMEQGTATATDGCNHTTSLSTDDALICSICLGTYDDDESTRNIDSPEPQMATTTTDISSVFQSSTCVHQFHMECILNWLQRKSNNECPCCRTPMIDDREVWKTIVQLRKQKRRALQKSQKQERPKKQTIVNHNENDNDDRVDETAHSETDHGGEY